MIKSVYERKVHVYQEPSYWQDLELISPYL